jgi:hypothetical protein
MSVPHFPYLNGHTPVGCAGAATHPWPLRPGRASKTPPTGRAGDPSNERLGLDLLRCRGKSISGDLNIDDKGTQHNFEPLQSIHHYSISYQSV